MKIPSRTLAVLAVALLAGPARSARAPGGDEATRFTFQSPPVNSMGVKSMADLLGKPVLIDFWGTR